MLGFFGGLSGCLRRRLSGQRLIIEPMPSRNERLDFFIAYYTFRSLPVSRHCADVAGREAFPAGGHVSFRRHMRMIRQIEGGGAGVG